MLALLIPVGIGCVLYLTRTGRKVASPLPRECSPAHEEVFVRAMHSSRPKAILCVAQAFDAEGFDPSYGVRLRARASLPSRSLQWKAAVESVFRKALASGNPEAVQAVAEAFAAQGLMCSARILFELAESLERVREIEEVEMVLEEEAPQEETSEPLPEDKRVRVETEEPPPAEPESDTGGAAQ
jgi:hypothetical protein